MYISHKMDQKIGFARGKLLADGKKNIDGKYNAILRGGDRLEPARKQRSSLPGSSNLTRTCAHSGF